MKIINSFSSYALILLLIITGSTQLMAQNKEHNIASDNLSSNASANDAIKRKNWNFVAYLDDTMIGYHNFEVINKDGEMIVNTQAKFDVKFMFITVYSYEHKNKEIWSKNCLISLHSSTLDDGDDLFVKLSNTNGNTRIVTPDSNITKKSCIRSFAYWDYELMNYKELLNVQTGELIDVNYYFVGAETINVNNQPVDARHYQLKGKDSAGKIIDISLWYNANNQWIALKSVLDNGRSLRYQLTQESVL